MKQVSGRTSDSKNDSSKGSSYKRQPKNDQQHNLKNQIGSKETQQRSSQIPILKASEKQPTRSIINNEYYHQKPGLGFQRGFQPQYQSTNEAINEERSQRLSEQMRRLELQHLDQLQNEGLRPDSDMKVLDSLDNVQEAVNQVDSIVYSPRSQEGTYQEFEIRKQNRDKNYPYLEKIKYSDSFYQKELYFEERRRDKKKGGQAKERIKFEMPMQVLSKKVVDQQNSRYQSPMKENSRIGEDFKTITYQSNISNEEPLNESENDAVGKELALLQNSPPVHDGGSHSPQVTLSKQLQQDSYDSNARSKYRRTEIFEELKQVRPPYKQNQDQDLSKLKHQKDSNRRQSEFQGSRQYQDVDILQNSIQNIDNLIQNLELMQGPSVSLSHDEVNIQTFNRHKQVGNEILVIQQLNKESLKDNLDLDLQLLALTNQLEAIQQQQTYAKESIYLKEIELLELQDETGQEENEYRNLELFNTETEEELLANPIINQMLSIGQNQLLEGRNKQLSSLENTFQQEEIQWFQHFLDQNTLAPLLASYIASLRQDMIESDECSPDIMNIAEEIINKNETILEDLQSQLENQQAINEELQENRQNQINEKNAGNELEIIKSLLDQNQQSDDQADLKHYFSDEEAKFQQQVNLEILPRLILEQDQILQKYQQLENSEMLTLEQQKQIEINSLTQEQNIVLGKELIQGMDKVEQNLKDLVQGYESQQLRMQAKLEDLQKQLLKKQKKEKDLNMRDTKIGGIINSLEEQLQYVQEECRQVDNL